MIVMMYVGCDFTIDIGDQDSESEYESMKSTSAVDTETKLSHCSPPQQLNPIQTGGLKYP